MSALEREAADDHQDDAERLVELQSGGVIRHVGEREWWVPVRRQRLVRHYIEG